MEMIDAEREMIKRARDQCVAETKKFVECTKVGYSMFLVVLCLRTSWIFHCVDHHFFFFPSLKEKWFPSQSCKEEFKEYEKCLSQLYVSTVVIGIPRITDAKQQQKVVQQSITVRCATI